MGIDFDKMRADYRRLIVTHRDRARWAIQRLREGYAPAAKTLADARHDSHFEHAMLRKLEGL